ncbi:MAG: hypothetical protein NVS1B11_20190 [Terriglobales bacterium]
MRRTFAVLCARILLATLASATTVIPFSVEQLTQASTQVVEARAIQSWSQWNPSHSFILTYTQFKVQRTLKGQASATLVVQQLGGKLDGITQRVSGVHAWNSGEKAILFLRPMQLNDGKFVVTGVFQGNFRVTGSSNGVPLVSNGVPDASAYSVKTREASAYRGGAMSVQELESRVQRAAKR